MSDNLIRNYASANNLNQQPTPNLAENIIGYGGNQALRALGSTAYDPEQPFFQENTLETLVFRRGSRISRDLLGPRKTRVFLCFLCF